MTSDTRIKALPTKLGQAVRNVEPHPKTSLSDIILGGQDGLVNVLAVATLFAAGSYKARSTVGHPGKSGLQMAIIGIVSALAGYLVGVLFGAPTPP